MNDTIVVAIISFIAGAFTGYFINRFMSKKILGFDADARMNFLLIIVTLAWLLSVIVDLLSVQYETSPLIHALMGAIVGFFFVKPGREK